MRAVLLLELSLAVAFNPAGIARTRSEAALQPRAATLLKDVQLQAGLQVSEILLDACNMHVELREQSTGLPAISHEELPQGFGTMVRALSTSMPITVFFDGNAYNSMLSSKEWMCDHGESTGYRIRFTETGTTADDILVEYVAAASEGAQPATEIGPEEAISLLQSTKLPLPVVTVKRRAHRHSEKVSSKRKERDDFLTECGLPDRGDVVHLPSFTEAQRTHSLKWLEKIVSHSDYFKFARIDTPSRLVVTDDRALRRRLSEASALIFNRQQFFTWVHSFPVNSTELQGTLTASEPDLWRWGSNVRLDRLVNILHSHCQNSTYTPPQLSRVFLDASNMQLSLHEQPDRPSTIAILEHEMLPQLTQTLGQSLSVTAVFNGMALDGEYAGKQWTRDYGESGRCNVLFTDAETNREDMLVGDLEATSEGMPAPISIKAKEAVALLEKSELPRPVVVVQRHFGPSKRKKQQAFFHESGLSEAGSVLHLPSFTEAQRLRSLYLVRKLSNLASRTNNFTFAQINTPTSLLVTDDYSIRQRGHMLNLPVVILSREQLLDWIQTVPGSSIAFSNSHVQSSHSRLGDNRTASSMEPSPNHGGETEVSHRSQGQSSSLQRSALEILEGKGVKNPSTPKIGKRKKKRRRSASAPGGSTATDCQRSDEVPAR